MEQDGNWIEKPWNGNVPKWLHQELQNREIAKSYRLDAERRRKLRENVDR